MKFFPVAALFLTVFAFQAAEAGVNIGIGLDYTPIVSMEYVDSPDFDLEIYDNVAWQGRCFYDFENGFRAGGIFDYYSKSFDEEGYRTIKLSQWGIGLNGEYGYAITESGKTLISGGMETGYGELTDRSSSVEISDGSLWIGGLAGIRFHIMHGITCDLGYRLIFLEYEIMGPIEKKFTFSGSSLRLAFEYPIFAQRDKTD